MSNFMKLTAEQLSQKINFVREYTGSMNAADASILDANANVEKKNIATMSAEIHKDINIQINRKMMYDKMAQLFGSDIAEEYLRQLETHEIYKNDETSTNPYCVSISMYPFLLEGLKQLGGESVAPKHTNSFCGSFVNLTYAISAQFAGACLHKDQRLVFKTPNGLRAPKIGDFVEKHSLDGIFKNYQGTWEYQDVSDLEVWEDGKFVDVRRLYRRAYHDKIYSFTTASGNKVKTSKDHKFKVLFRGREIEVKAKDLKVGDTVFNTNHTSYPLDKNSDEYLKGQLIGIIAGDGCLIGDNHIRLSVNYKEKFIVDRMDDLFYKFYGKKGSLNGGNKCYDYRICSQEIIMGIRNFFVGDNYSSHPKRINVEEHSLEFLLGFLDGLLATDGGWNNTHNLSVANQSLAINMKDILEMLGFHSEVIEYEDHRDNRKIQYKCAISNQINPYLDLTLTKRSGNQKFLRYNSDPIFYYGAYTWKHSGGFNNSKRFFKTMSGSKKEDYQNYHLDVITRIDVEEEEKFVYEIETSSHWYSAGGILTHNCATVEFLMYLDYFLRKDYGEGYHDEYCNEVANHLQHVVYALNQPAAARGYQAVFWNISVFDKPYFEAMFGEFVFPDMTKPDWRSLDKLQRFFMSWFRKEREKAILTFPVVTAAMLTDDSGPVDKRNADFLASEMSKSNSFFIYMSDSADSLSSCCRLRNEIQDNTFSYSLGAGGVATGSISVITLNMNRLEQDGRDLQEQVQKIHKYQAAYRSIVQDYYDAGMLPVYSANFISLDKQFLTIGINGLVEAAEFQGITPGNNPEYKEFVSSRLKIIYDENRKARKKYGYLFNTELIPGENVGVKFANWDRDAGYEVPRDCYNSYFYPVEDESINILDKFVLHGKEINQYLDGGSALHLNLEEYPTKESCKKLFSVAARTGTNYFTTNVKITICNDCGKIDKQTRQSCIYCGSRNIDYATRIIGYLKRVSSFSSARQKEHEDRAYHTNAI